MTKMMKKRFEQRFHSFMITQVAAQLQWQSKRYCIEEIFERITQDIFNASLANGNNEYATNFHILTSKS